MLKHKILVVDDEMGVRFGIRDFLETQGYEVEEADTCRAALDSFRAIRPDIVILDYKLPDGNALDLLPRLRKLDPGVPLLILTGHGSIDLAVKAIKEGAENFLTKPVEMPALLVLLERLLENQRNRQKQMAGKSREARDVVDPFVGESKKIQALKEQAEKVVISDLPILIQGETGSGKGVLASWLHHHGPRSDEAFVDLNCAGLSREFLETELFGHEKGAFTGATAKKTGLLEVAHRGTVFLDEIGDMDMEVQPKLLKVLEEKRFRRLGDIRDRRVDIRLIAASHQDLRRLVTEKTFRSDLFFRISTIPLVVPPLRERVEDIPLLAEGFLRRCAAEVGRGEVRLADDAIKQLKRYTWPGNIRELRNVLERAVLLSDKDVLEAKDLRLDTAPTMEPPVNTSLTLLEVEQQHITRVLREEFGQVEEAAKRLGIPRSTLYQKIKKYGIQPSRN